MQETQRISKVFVSALVLSCLATWGCGKDATIEAKEQQAIQMVKAYQADTNAFSVISNIEKQAEDSGRQGDKWELGSWEAGLPSQKDLMLEKLSQFFNVFRPTGNYWVHFSYKDKNGTHEAMWDVNIYSKKVVPKNEGAKQFSPPSQS